MPRDDDLGGEAPCLMPLLDEEGRVRERDALHIAAARVRAKRIYEPADDDDGYRALVDRLWPRGIKKDAARLDVWLRELAPSDDLRRWFGHDPARWDEFARRYREELVQPERRDQVAELVERAHRGPLTMLYGARDTEHNNALVVRDLVISLLAHGQRYP